MTDLATEIDQLKSTLADNPRSVLFARLADYLLQTDQIEEAIRVCGYGLDHNPHYANGHFVLGKCHFQSGDLDAAESEFNKALLYDPNHINAHHFQAKIMKQRDWRNAYVLWIKRALAIDPLDQTTRMMMTELEEVRGGEAEAIEEDIDMDVVDEEPKEQSTSQDQLSEVEMAFSEEEDRPKDDEGEVHEEVFEEEDDLSLDDSSAAEPVEEVDDTLQEIDEDSTAGDDEEKRYEFILDDIFKEEGNTAGALTDEEEGGAADEGVIEEPYEEEETESTEVDESETIEEGPESESVVDEQETYEEPSQPPKPEVSLEEKERIADEVFGDEEEAELDEELNEEDVEEPEVEEEVEEDLEEDKLELTELESEQDIIEDVMDVEESKIVESDEEEDEEVDEEEAEEPMIDFAPSEEPDIEEALEADLQTEEEERQEDEPGQPEEEKSEPTSGKKDPIVTATLGEIYAAQGHYTKAIGVYEILLKKDPKNQHYKTKIEFLQKKMEEQERED